MAVEPVVGILVYYPESCSVFVFRRVVLARGSKGDSGYGANHSVIEWLLDGQDPRVDEGEHCQH